MENIKVQLIHSGHISIEKGGINHVLTRFQADKLVEAITEINDKYPLGSLSRVEPDIRLMPTALHLAHNVTHLMKTYGLDFDQAMAIVRESPPS